MDGYFENTKKRSKLSKVLWFLFVTAMLGNAVALSLSYLSTTLNPYTFWYVAFLGLGAPILMILNLIFLLGLGLKLSKWAFIPLVAMVLGLGFVGDFVQVEFVSKYPPQNTRKSKTEFSILTYNVHSFSQYGETNTYTLDRIIGFIQEKDPDIVCIQEYQVRNAGDAKLVADKLGQWKYQVTSTVIENGDYKWGLAIFSKLPLKKAKSIKFSGRTNSAMFVDVLVGSDTLRLFNCHLQSTQFNKLGRKRLQTSDPEDAARLVGSTLRENYKIRAFQADSIASILEKSPYPALVAGDFNDTPMSYVYSKIKGEMADAFRECGTGYEYTYIPFKKLFRIDYLLHSDKIETLSYESPLVTWSDHKPILSRLKLLSQQ